jgi:hypothetical protein
MLVAGTGCHVRLFSLAMFEALPANDPDIDRHEVSEDGVMWRPFDPERDSGRTLHRRIVFSAPFDQEARA